MSYPLDLELSELRTRRSEKWVSYPEDVLPLFVAESDVALAPPIAERLAAAVADGDTGYSADAEGLRDIVSQYYTRYGVEAAPGDVMPVYDVGVGVRAALSEFVPSGGRVVHHVPVYMPFPGWIRRAGHEPAPVPFAEDGGINLPAIEAELAAGARAVLLCHPHNPTGRIHPQAELAALAELADSYGAIVVSDEIWAPMALPGHEFHSFLAASNTARKVGFAISSASKTWNLAGLKCAFVITGNRAQYTLPPYLAGAAGHLGSLAARVALTEGEPWREQLMAALGENVDLLEKLLAEHLPKATMVRPESTYIAWIDASAYPELGDNPAKIFLSEAKVAFSPGIAFGPGGEGHFRVNFACNPAVLTEAFERVGRAVSAKSD